MSRTLVVAPFLLLIPAFALGFLSFGITLLIGYSRPLESVAFVLIVATTLSGLLWWSWGTHRKFLALLSEGRIVGALLAFLFSIAGFLILLLSARELAPILFVPASAYEKTLAACERADSTWVGKPWTVMAIPELNRIVATGSIGEGSAKALELAMLRNPGIKLLELDSGGGLVLEQDMLIQLVEKHQLDTLVIGKCASACTGVFLAGRRRFITPDSRFGFHRAGYCGMQRNGPWLDSDYMSAIHYREQGVHEDFLGKALATDPYELWRPSALAVKQGGFATDWWSDRPIEYSRSLSGT